jgi:hypothetical protein
MLLVEETNPGHFDRGPRPMSSIESRTRLKSTNSADKTAP